MAYDGHFEWLSADKCSQMLVVSLSADKGYSQSMADH